MNYALKAAAIRQPAVGKFQNACHRVTYKSKDGFAVKSFAVRKNCLRKKRFNFP